MSIIIGVLQMTLGLILHLLNAIEFRKPLDAIFEFIPRFLFLEAIFGYLCFMIFFKWGRDWMGQDIYNLAHNITGDNATGIYTGTSQTPVLLNELIYMFLIGTAENHNHLYPVQFETQLVLLLIAVISVPFMFLVKPFILKHQHNKSKKGPAVSTAVVDDPKIESSEESLDDSKVEKVDKKGKEKEQSGAASSAVHGRHEEEEEEFQFGEIFIHQLLETIEFVLGSVSHTASYLRLWALSLAHSELATVFWEKIMFEVLSVTQDNDFYIEIALISFLGFSVWFMVTLLVMMFMELLSALLHALRLHWVEFQSKFYKGDGYAFVPFALKKVYSGNRLPDVTKQY